MFPQDTKFPPYTLLLLPPIPSVSTLQQSCPSDELWVQRGPSVRRLPLWQDFDLLSAQGGSSRSANTLSHLQPSVRVKLSVARDPVMFTMYSHCLAQYPYKYPIQGGVKFRNLERCWYNPDCTPISCFTGTHLCGCAQFYAILSHVEIV